MGELTNYGDNTKQYPACKTDDQRKEGLDKHSKQS